jgi:hypothetical protein
MFMKPIAIKILCAVFLLQHFAAHAQTVTVKPSATMGLGALNKISDASNINMNGGILSTGSGGGFSETVGTLTLSDNSTIALGTGDHTLTFAPSGGVSWTAGKTLTITGWTGSFNSTTGTAGKIKTHTTTDLTTDQLAQIRFLRASDSKYYTAAQLFGTGEVVATASEVLPIELLSFKAKLKNNVVELNWQTATETNNDYFVIERSVDGKVWEAIDTVKGAGTSLTLLNYLLVDEKPLLGSSYYRLKQVDFDQKFSYSDIAVVNFEGFKIEALFPNPSDGNINLVMKSSIEASIDLTIYNAIGQMIKTQAMQITKGANTLHVQFEAANGKYLITVKSTDGAYYDYTVVLNK